MKAKRRITALSALLLCAVIVLGTSMPALALTGSVNHQITNHVLKIKQTCTGHFYDDSARSTITLTFLPNEPHDPPDSYWCYTIMDLHESNALHHYEPAGGHMSCDTGVKNVSAMTITAAEFYYNVNDVEIYSEEF